MKINKAIGMSASFLVAGAMLVGGIAPASAAPMPRDVATVAVAAQAPTTYEVKAGKKDGRPVVELTLSNGRAVQNNDGTVTLVDAAGKVITTYGQTITDPTTGQSAAVTYKVNAAGNVVSIYPTQQADSTSNDTKIAKSFARRINQQCALNNLLWGMGGGAATGLVGGPGGVAVGILTGAIISGVQSATSC